MAFMDIAWLNAQSGHSDNMFYHKVFTFGRTLWDFLQFWPSDILMIFINMGFIKPSFPTYNLQKYALPNRTYSKSYPVSYMVVLAQEVRPTKL